MNVALNPSDIALPALLRAARAVYAKTIRAALAAVDCGDLPKNGIFVLGAMARGDLPMTSIIRRLRMSKQATGQLVDTLVLRGYLEREVDAADRRRLIISLSERGRAAAAVTRATVQQVEDQLAQRVPRDWIEHTRATLLAITGDADEP